MATIQDDRTPEQKSTHRYLVIMTDSFMSGWGGASGGSSFAAWACEGNGAAKRVERWVRSRSDARRVRVTVDTESSPYRPGRTCAHLHIYVVTDGHPSLA